MEKFVFLNKSLSTNTRLVDTSQLLTSEVICLWRGVLFPIVFTTINLFPAPFFDSYSDGLHYCRHSSCPRLCLHVSADTTLSKPTMPPLLQS